MEEQISAEEFRRIAAYAINHLNGAWFMATAGKIGITEAIELVDMAWEDWTTVLFRRIKEALNLEGSGMAFVREALPRIDQVFQQLTGFKMNIQFNEDRIVTRVVECGYWESMKKNGLGQLAEARLLCSTVHLAAYRGIFKGAFPDMQFEFTHTKRIPDGDPYCEMIIRAKPENQRRE